MLKVVGVFAAIILTSLLLFVCYQFYSMFFGSPIARYEFKRNVTEMMETEYPSKPYEMNAVSYSLKQSAQNGYSFHTYVELTRSGQFIRFWTQEGMISFETKSEHAVAP